MQRLYFSIYYYTNTIAPTSLLLSNHPVSNHIPLPSHDVSPEKCEKLRKIIFGFPTKNERITHTKS